MTSKAGTCKVHVKSPIKPTRDRLSNAVAEHNAGAIVNYLVQVHQVGTVSEGR